MADKIYPNRTPVLTSYTSAQLARVPRLERRTYRKFNSLIRKYRIRVEHAIADLKTYTFTLETSNGYVLCVLLWSADVKSSVIFYENKREPIDRPKT